MAAELSHPPFVNAPDRGWILIRLETLKRLLVQCLFPGASEATSVFVLPLNPLNSNKYSLGDADFSEYKVNIDRCLFPKCPNYVHSSSHHLRPAV